MVDIGSNYGARLVDKVLALLYLINRFSVNSVAVRPPLGLAQHLRQGMTAATRSSTVR